MLKKETILTVLDNSGVLKVKVFNIYGGSVVKFATVGDLILVSLRQITPRVKIKGKVSKGIVATVKKWVRRANGHYIRSNLNTIILLRDDGELEGTLVNGMLFSEVFFKQKTRSALVSKDLV